MHKTGRYKHSKVKYHFHDFAKKLQFFIGTDEIMHAINDVMQVYKVLRITRRLNTSSHKHFYVINFPFYVIMVSACNVIFKARGLTCRAKPA